MTAIVAKRLDKQLNKLVKMLGRIDIAVGDLVDAAYDLFHDLEAAAKK